VLEAARPHEALAISQSDQRIDLLLTDIVMPDMSGRALSTMLREERPGLKVVYTSGYTDDRVLHHGVSEASLPFVQKPFTPATLLAKIREVLDTDGASKALIPNP
jgi:CheY-like chemotaxis protein